MEQKRFTIDGVNYVIQMIPAEVYFDIMDNNKDDNGNMKTGAYIKSLVGAMMVQPKFRADDYTGKIRLLRAINKECEAFVMGDEVKVGETEEEKKPEITSETFSYRGGLEHDGYSGDLSQRGSSPMNPPAGYPSQNYGNSTQQ